MGVDVVDLVEIGTPIAQGRYHASGGALSILCRCGNVKGIRTHAVTGELRVDPRAARLRGVVLLADHHAGSLAQHESVAANVPRTTRGLRIVVAGAHGLRSAEPPDAKR